MLQGKLKLPNKIDVFNKAIAPVAHCGLCLPDSGVSLSNHWFAGFVQGDGCFFIKILNPIKPGRAHPVSVVLTITLKQEDLLRSIKATFGGYVSINKGRGTYQYTSSECRANIRRLVAYFDQYQVMGSCYRLYLCWRRAHHLIEEKKHLTREGLEEIKGLKAFMTRLRF